ncbi:hypothetical protein RSOLAG1IB_09982 [Rhizoctonia solani AG-1 IB]|uniref:Uncharacterized protein n=1 Tax=Thanatephorus cucumeris (strain AG1-IB / isolate 7/3/14) TaxID=1108050 RepID=A0A0B7FWW9_THACB|nr:hypothetical protein RSOLAG1IB_09982 [Rhizoctonia solani AG-1 IB]
MRSFATEPPEAAKLILGRIGRGVACHTTLFVFTPWEFSIFTISLWRLCASPFPPHVLVRAPRARDESDPFLPFFYESHPLTPCRRLRTTHAPVFLLGHADAQYTTGCWPPTRARPVARPRRHPSSAYRLSCPHPTALRSRSSCTIGLTNSHPTLGPRPSLHS